MDGNMISFFLFATRMKKKIFNLLIGKRNKVFCIAYSQARELFVTVYNQTRESQQMTVFGQIIAESCQMWLLRSVLPRIAEWGSLKLCWAP